MSTEEQRHRNKSLEPGEVVTPPHTGNNLRSPRGEARDSPRAKKSTPINNSHKQLDRRRQTNMSDSESNHSGRGRNSSSSGHLKNDLNVDGYPKKFSRYKFEDRFLDRGKNPFRGRQQFHRPRGMHFPRRPKYGNRNFYGRRSPPATELKWTKTKPSISYAFNAQHNCNSSSEKSVNSGKSHQYVGDSTSLNRKRDDMHSSQQDQSSEDWAVDNGDDEGRCKASTPAPEMTSLFSPKPSPSLRYKEHIKYKLAKDLISKSVSAHDTSEKSKKINVEAKVKHSDKEDKLLNRANIWKKSPSSLERVVSSFGAIDKALKPAVEDMKYKKALETQQRIGKLLQDDDDWQLQSLGLAKGLLKKSERKPENTSVNPTKEKTKLAKAPLSFEPAEFLFPEEEDSSPLTPIATIKQELTSDYSALTYESSGTIEAKSSIKIEFSESPSENPMDIKNVRIKAEEPLQEEKPQTIHKETSESFSPMAAEEKGIAKMEVPTRVPLNKQAQEFGSSNKVPVNAPPADMLLNMGAQTNEAQKLQLTKDFKKLKTLESNLARIKVMRANYDSADEISDELIKMENLFLQEKSFILQKYSKANALPPSTIAEERPAQQQQTDDKIFDVNRETVKLTIAPIKLCPKASIFTLKSHASEQISGAADALGHRTAADKASVEDEIDFTDRLTKPKEVAVVKPIMGRGLDHGGPLRHTRSRSRSAHRWGPDRFPQHPRGARVRYTRRGSRDSHSPLNHQRCRRSSTSPSSNLVEYPNKHFGNRRGSAFRSRSRSISRSRSRSLTRSRSRSRSNCGVSHCITNRPTDNSYGKRRHTTQRRSMQRYSRSPPTTRPLSFSPRRSYSSERVSSSDHLTFRPPSPPIFHHMQQYEQARTCSNVRSRYYSSSPPPNYEHFDIQSISYDPSSYAGVGDLNYMSEYMPMSHSEFSQDMHDMTAYYGQMRYQSEEAEGEQQQIPTINIGLNHVNADSHLCDFEHEAAFGNNIHNSVRNVSVLKEVPMASGVAVQKGNVLEIVPSSDLSINDGAKEAKHTTNNTWKEEVCNRNETSGALRQQRLKNENYGILKCQNGGEVIKNEIIPKKKVFFEDGIYPNLDSDEEDYEAVMAKIRRKVIKIHLKNKKDTAKNSDTAIWRLVKRKENRPVAVVASGSTVPPPAGIPKQHLEQPIYKHQNAVSQFLYFQFDHIYNTFVITERENFVQAQPYHMATYIASSPGYTAAGATTTPTATTLLSAAASASINNRYGNLKTDYLKLTLKKNYNNKSGNFDSPGARPSPTPPEQTLHEPFATQSTLNKVSHLKLAQQQSPKNDSGNQPISVINTRQQQNYNIVAVSSHANAADVPHFAEPSEPQSIPVHTMSASPISVVSTSREKIYAKF